MKLVKTFIYPAIIIALITAITPLLLGEIRFHTDIARDFLLFDEIARKKIVLIGPRASGLDGFFHGPLWLYLNMPFYLLGKGNPIIVGWGWIIISIVFLLTTKLLMDNILKDKYLSWIYIAVFVSVFTSHLNGLYNPYGALLLTVPFIITLFGYLKYNQEKYLFIALIILGAIIHLQIAVAGPFALGSLPLIIFRIIKSKKFVHLKSFLAIPLTTITYFIFDLRHNFQLSKALLSYINGKTKAIPLDTKIVISNRLEILTYKGINLFENQILDTALFIIFLITAAILLITFYKKEKLKDPEKIFLLSFYFYISFYIFSTIHKGWLLDHYFLPVMSIPIFLISIGTSLSNYPKKLYISLIIVLLFIWTLKNIQMVINSKNSIGKDENSWIYQSKVARTVFEQNDKDFGFFIFSPDILAYQTKAAMNYYIKKNPDTKVYIYQKRPTTYLIIAPPPKDQPWNSHLFWKKDKVKIEKEPMWSKEIPPVGYKIEKYQLNEEELKISPDPNINDWVHYR